MTAKKLFYFSVGGGPISSAGVFDSTGTLVRTLWSASANDPRVSNPAAAWEGLLDDGVTVATTGTYTVKLLQNNVQYKWEGAIGNSSPDHTYSNPNVFYHTNFTPFGDMSASSTELYFVTSYHERNPTPQVVKISNPQSPRPIVASDFRLPYLTSLFSCTDGTLAYVGTENGSTDSFVWAVSTVDGAEFRLCLKTPATFSSGTSYSYGRVSSVCGLDITPLFGGQMNGLAVQQGAGSYLFLSRGQKNQIVTLNKTTGATLQSNTTIGNPQRIATNPVTGDLWVIHDVFHPGTLVTGAGGFWNVPQFISGAGANVTGWNDWTVQKNNFAAPGQFASTDPQFNATGFNGSFPGISFVSTSGMSFPASFTSTTMSFWMLGSFTLTGSGNRIFSNSSGTNDFTTPQWDVQDAGVNQISLVSSGTQGNGGNPVTVTSPALIGFVFDGAHANVWLNGSVVGTGTAFSATLGHSGNFQALGVTSSQGSVPFTVASMGLTEKVLNSTDWANLAKYCNTNFGTTFPGGTLSGPVVEKYTVDGSGNLVSTGVVVSGLSNPLALNVTFDGSTLLVCDGGTSHQVKAFNTSDGSVKTAFGTNGVFGIAGGYVNSPAVTLTKFLFRNDMSNGTSPAFITCVPDGTFWVGDIGNYRYLHFSSGNSPTYIEQIACTPVAYNVRLCRNDNTRLFIDFLEFKIDYTQPLSPTNGSWQLVNNWWGNMNPTFMPNIGGYTGAQQLQYLRTAFSSMIYALTASNGRTYAGAAVSGFDCRIFELTNTGLRVCGPGVTGEGMLPFNGTYIDANFNIWYPTFLEAGASTQINLNAFAGFDNLNNPTWLDIGLSPGQASGQGPGVPTLTTPVMPANTDSPGNTGEFAHIETLANGVVPMFDPDSGFRNPDTTYHLVGINFTAQTVPFATHQANAPNTYYGGYSGDLTFLNFPEAPFFAYGNGVGTNGGGPLHYIPGQTHFFTGYRGEDWANNQTNVWSHWDQSGLLINRFGPVGPYSGAAGCAQIFEGTPKIPYTAAPNFPSSNVNALYSWRGMPGFAGNSTFGSLALFNGVYYIYQNDEWYHGGVSRWSVSNVSSVRTTSQIVNWVSGSYTPVNDPTNLLQGLPFSSSLVDGTAGWHRNPTTDVITGGDNAPQWIVFTNAVTSSVFNPDLTFQANNNAATYTLYRDFPAGGTGNWILSGNIFQTAANNLLPPGPYSTGTIFIDVLDSSARILVRWYIGYNQGVDARWWVNDVVALVTDDTTFKYYAQAQTPFSIVGHVGTGAINLTWGPFTASTTKFNVAADITAPSRLLLSYVSVGGGSYGLNFSKLNWVRLP